MVFKEEIGSCHTDPERNPLFRTTVAHERRVICARQDPSMIRLHIEGKAIPQCGIYVERARDAGQSTSDRIVKAYLYTA